MEVLLFSVIFWQERHCFWVFNKFKILGVFTDYLDKLLRWFISCFHLVLTLKTPSGGTSPIGLDGYVRLKLIYSSKSTATNCWLVPVEISLSLDVKSVQTASCKILNSQLILMAQRWTSKQIINQKYISSSLLDNLVASETFYMG